MPPERPFYRLGSVRVLEEVPRPAFLAFLRDRFAGVPARIDEAALAAILDEAEDVPYNVQLLAHHCWNALRDEGRKTTLTAPRVHAIHVGAARRLDPVYSQVWLGLTAPQRRALQALVTIGSDGLYSQAATRGYRISATTMQKSLDALAEKRVCWRQTRGGETRLRLEDPLFGRWVRETIVPAAP